jgi:hypothetical protein
MARSPFLRRIPPVLDSSPRQARALTAAGQRIDPLNEAQVRRVTAQPRDWQMRALGYYDDLGEVRYGARWMGDAISRLRVIPAYQETATTPPTGLEVADRPESELTAASGAIARLAVGAESGMAGLMRNLAINVWLVGEAYLIGYVDPETALEQWDVASVEALVRDPRGGLALRTSPSTQPQEAVVPLDPEASVVIQVMRRHPRWRDWPDAAMRGALEYCEDLSLLTRMIRATASSRVPAGMLFIPDEASFGAANPGDADGDLDRDPLTEDLLRHMTEPIRTPGDAAAVVPFVLRMSRADIAAVRLETLDRPIDSLAVQLREEARRSLAAVLDLPAEIMAGKGDLNHWTAWQVDAEAFSVHVEPLAVLILDALTTEYYQPALDAMGVENPGRHRLWYDASALIAAPDATETVIKLYDRGEITGDALRAAVGIAETEAPDEAELARRRALAEIIAFHRGGQIESSGGAPGLAGPPGVTAGPPAQAAIEAPLAWPAGLAPARPLIAAPEPLALPDPAEVMPEPGTPRSQIDYRPLGDALARLDRELRMRVQQAADELARRALERAGNRLRSLAQKDRSGLSSRTVAALPASEVAATLGPARIEAFGITVAELADGALEPMHARFTRWMVQALDATIALLEPFAEPGFDWTSYRDRMSESVRNAWADLSAAVDATVAERLVTPNPTPPEVGEYDDTVLVPPSVVRRAIQQAWGGPIAPSITAAIPGPLAAEMVGGLITSDMLYDMLAESARLILGNDGWRWAYGSSLSRVSPFEPHRRLDGTEFTDWEGAELRNVGGGWPGDFLYPGDHLWCQCDVVPLIAPEPTPQPQASTTQQRAEIIDMPEPLEPAVAPEPELPPHLRPDPQFSADPVDAADQFYDWTQQYGFSQERYLSRMAVHEYVAKGGTPDDLAEFARLLVRAEADYGLANQQMLPSARQYGAKGRFHLSFDNEDSIGSYRASIGRVNLSPGKQESKARSYGMKWTVGDTLTNTLAHELGHHVARHYVGEYRRQAEVMSAALRRVMDANPDLIDDALAARLKGKRDAGRLQIMLERYLSRYAGSTTKGNAYSNLYEHSGSEGFAELFGTFYAPGGCATLEAAKDGPARLRFARLMRAALNAEMGYDLIPDCD